MRAGRQLPEISRPGICGISLGMSACWICLASSYSWACLRRRKLGVSIPNCWAYSELSRGQSNFMASAPTMRPMGVPMRRRSRTSKQMCHPAAPMEMKRRSMLCHSVRRVPPRKASSSHRISLSPQLYSSTLGASARVTVVSETCGLGARTVVSFTVVPTVPRLPSASKGAHSRRCAGSVSACQTFSGAWRSSRTRMSVHFSPSFRICAPLAGPGVYCSRSGIFFSLASIACQLRQLNQVAAGVVQHRNGRAGHVLRRHRELGPARLDPFVVALDVVREEHRRRLALLKHRLLVRFGRGVAVQRQLQLCAVRFLGRGHGQPAKWALAEIGLLGKAQYLRIEAQGLVLVVHVYAGHFDFHFVSPLSRSRFGPRRLLLVFLFVGVALVGDERSIRSRWRSRAST